MQPFNVVRARTSDLLIPADSEFVLEGVVHANRRHAEGLLLTSLKPTT
jgi:UbiD family decarboxylase